MASLFSSNVLKGMFAAVALGAAVCAAAPASAADITLVSDSMDTSYGSHVLGPNGFNVFEHLGPITFKALDSANNPFTFSAYCVDLFHDITLGNLNLKYTNGLLTTDNGNPPVMLSTSQLNEISGLINFSVTLTNQAATDLGAKLAAIQGAIWEIANPAYNVVAENALVNTYIDQFEAEAPNLKPGSISVIVPVDGKTQSFAIAGGVPEPATWGLMILGFGGVGVMMRRRRNAVAFA